MPAIRGACYLNEGDDLGMTLAASSSSSSLRQPSSLRSNWRSRRC